LSSAFLCQDRADGDQADAGGSDDEENPPGKPGGFREYGKSKDSRDDRWRLQAFKCRLASG
jgi:hypothetical protein